MKDIRGHKSRNQGEIIAILIKSGTYTCPTLPHYRYERVKEICWRLRKASLVAPSGRNPESTNLVVTPLFREWQSELAQGRTNLGALSWAKEKTHRDLPVAEVARRTGDLVNEEVG